MKFKEAMLLSKLGVKVRCTMWQPNGYVTHITYSTQTYKSHSGFSGTDEDNEIYDIHPYNLHKEWECFNDKETDTNLSSSGA